MGDRTYCTLWFLKEPDPKLLDLLSDHLGVSDYAEDRAFNYDEVNNGNLPDAIEQALMAGNVSFAWQWQAGCDYGPGVFIHHEREWDTFDVFLDQIGLTIDQADDPHRRAYVRKFSNIFEEIKHGVS